MLPLTTEEFESWKHSKLCYASEDKLHKKDKIYRKVRNLRHFTGKHRGAAQCICSIIYAAPK